MWELKELRRSGTALCTKAWSNKFCMIPGCGRSKQSLNSWAGERWCLVWHSSRWEVLRMKVILEGLLTTGYILKNRKANPVLFVSLWVTVSGRPSLPIYYSIGLPQSIVSNWISPFSPSVFLMIIGFNTYVGISCSGAVTLASALLLEVTEWTDREIQLQEHVEEATEPAPCVQLFPDARCISWLPYLLIMAHQLLIFVLLRSCISLLLGRIRREG